MAKIPTDEQIREELHAMIDSDPKLKCCANCIHYNLVAQYCSKIDKFFPRYFYGCKHYITAEEMLIWLGFIALASIFTSSYKTCLVYWLEQVAFGSTFTAAIMYSL